MKVELCQFASDGTYMLRYERRVHCVTITISVPSAGAFTLNDLDNFWKAVKAIEHMDGEP